MTRRQRFAFIHPRPGKEGFRMPPGFCALVQFRGLLLSTILTVNK